MTEDRGIWIFFGLLWSALTLLFDGFLIVPAVRQVQAQRFVTTNGTVLSSVITDHVDDEGDRTHGVQITYSYRVGGQAYRGDRLRYDTFTSSDVTWSRRVVEEHSVGSATAVYYDPSAPENSVLQPGLTGSELLEAMFMTPFNVIMVSFWWPGWSWIRPRRHGMKQVPGGIKIWTRSSRTHVRLDGVSPILLALVTMVCLNFLGAFVVTGFAGVDPSLLVMQITGTIILMVGMMVGLWQWKDLRAGKYDLVHDKLKGTLQLTRMCGRKTTQTVPVAAVLNVIVETVEKRNSDGNSTYTYIPTLQLNTPPGQVERLVEWDDAERAKDFIAWLAEDLWGPRPLKVMPAPIH